MRALGPRYICVYPPLSPTIARRRPRRSLPFPLEDASCRLYLEARQGLWAALTGMGVGPGVEVIAPAYHHGSEIEAIVRTGARCRFYDCRDGFEPDADELDSLLRPTTRALYLIHTIGYAQDSERWRQWCDKRGLLLIEDGAQSWLGARGGKPVGSAADISLFCLYKAFGLGDGGAVTSRVFGAPAPGDEGLGLRGTAGRLADWTAQRSRVAASALRHRRQPPSEDEVPDRHFSLTATDERVTRATRALVSRVVDPDAPRRRRENHARLRARLADLQSPAFAQLPPESSPLVFPIEIDDKPAFVRRLERRGIVQTRMWTVPHPSLDAGEHPGAARLRRRLVGLPVHQELRAADVDDVAEAVLAER
jgi:perosamine synthetase